MHESNFAFPHTQIIPKMDNSIYLNMFKCDTDMIVATYAIK